MAQLTITLNSAFGRNVSQMQWQEILTEIQAMMFTPLNRDEDIPIHDYTSGDVIGTFRIHT